MDEFKLPSNGNNYNSFAGYNPNQSVDLSDFFKMLPGNAENGNNPYNLDFSQAFSAPASPAAPENTGLFQNFQNGEYGSLGDYGSLLKGIGSLYGAYQGGKQLDLAEDQFNFQKDNFNRNLGNRATLINQRLDDRATARKAALGSSYNYGPTKHVDGSAI